MSIILLPILQAIAGLIGFYKLIIFVYIVMQWLIVLQVFDISKYPIISNIYMVTRMLTEPVFGFVRRFIPNLGPLDLSPLVVIVFIYILSNIIRSLIWNVYSSGF